jgi:hypothetical protein
METSLLEDHLVVGKQRDTSHNSTCKILTRTFMSFFSFSAVQATYLSRSYTPAQVPTKRLCGNGDLNLNTGLDVDDDLLDNLGGGVEVDEAYGSLATSRGAL